MVHGVTSHLERSLLHLNNAGLKRRVEPEYDAANFLLVARVSSPQEDGPLMPDGTRQAQIGNTDVMGSNATLSCVRMCTGAQVQAARGITHISPSSGSIECVFPRSTFMLPQ